MLKLIRLEWKKHSMWKYVRNAAIAAAAVTGMLMLIASDPGTGDLVAETGKSTIHSLTELFMNMVYLVFTGTMLVSFVVGEYENKLIGLMFSYPIKRKKILLSKVLAVCIFNFAALLLSKLAAYAALALVRPAAAAGIDMGQLSFWVSALASAAISVACGCIVLLVGMKVKSSKATLIAAFVIMLAIMGVTQGNVLPCTSAAGIIGYAVQAAGAAAGVFLSLHGAETEDVM